MNFSIFLLLHYSITKADSKIPFLKLSFNNSIKLDYFVYLLVTNSFQIDWKRIKFQVS